MNITFRFYRKYKMPVLGCIDGTHVAIVCPDKNEERFYNRKKYHSLNVLIVSLIKLFYYVCWLA